MKRIAFFLIVFLIIFQACKKEDNGNNQPPQESVLDYMPLNVGNYWIYENYSCDSGEINCDQSFSIDTNSITKDTIIDGNTYFKIEGAHLYYKGPRYFRDSGDYIVDNHGKVIFTINQSDQIYNPMIVVSEADTLYQWYYRLKNSPENITVKAGTYNCYDFRGSFFDRHDNFQSERNMHNYYSKNVGLVKETTFFASSPRVFKRELVGYVIQPKSEIIP